MKRLMLPFLVLATICSCSDKPKNNDTASLNQLAERYIVLGLEIGKYDGDFVDAYYGPDSLKPKDTSRSAVFPKDDLLAKVNALSSELGHLDSVSTNDSVKTRAKWMLGQLTAFGQRIKIFSGETTTFDGEAKNLFGVDPPHYDEKHFQSLIAELDSLLPGVGNLQDRFQALAKKFIIPKEKLDTVFKTAIAEARKRTLAHYALPANENFSLEYVTNKPWSGYNWYQGNYQSKIQINTDLPIYIDRAIDLACHEGYPGHHVYNMLLEKNLYRDRGSVEISLYPLFSPQSLIAEGSANYGIQVAFPGDEQEQFTKNVLLPLAGIDTTAIGFYFKALAIRGKLNYVRNEVARGIVNNTLKEEEPQYWLVKYGLFNPAGADKSIHFIQKYRSYVINYNYGLDLVKNYIESRGGTAGNPAKRWELFGWLLSNQVLTKNLLGAK